MRNFDFKSILIFILLTLLMGVAYNWYFKADKDYKNQVKMLRDENIKIKNTRDSLSTNILNLEKEFIIIKDREDSLNNRIKILDIQISDARNKANKSKAELDALRIELLETNKKIKELRNNPPNRTGEDLINSIKNKTQR
jgi:peptidoglycan hydrolase CwlO-like protein